MLGSKLAMLWLPGFIFLVFTLESCKSENVILVKREMEFVGQFNKGFGYAISGFGPILERITFSEQDLLDLAREQMPEFGEIQRIEVVDIGMRIRPDSAHAAQVFNIRVSQDSTTVDVAAIEELLIQGDLQIDPSQFGLGDDYVTMVQELNAILLGKRPGDYFLNLLLEPKDDSGMSSMQMDVVFSITFSFTACVDVPAGTDAKNC